jgi:hypothetical protein
MPRGKPVALPGKRVEVSHGTNRFANLDVSLLLQRLEDHSVRAYLASNLRNQIDEAFVGRFHVMLPFPRPGPEEAGASGGSRSGRRRPSLASEGSPPP